MDGLRFDSFPLGSLFYNNMTWDINKFQLNILFILTYISNFHMILQQYELTMTTILIQTKHIKIVASYKRVYATLKVESTSYMSRVNNINVDLANMGILSNFTLIHCLS